MTVREATTLAERIHFYMRWLDAVQRTKALYNGNTTL